MALDQRKYDESLSKILRDTRPLMVRVGDKMSEPSYSAATFGAMALCLFLSDVMVYVADIIMACGLLYFWFLKTRDTGLHFKLPMSSKLKDVNNSGPGRNNKAEGILYLGNVDKTNEEVWFTNSDIRTHILYLGTTGSGKTEGLKSMVANALCWGSGFVYVDGKADTDLWSSLSSMVRRFGRDDDLMVLNYMTGNSDTKSPSNTMNPFSTGSASYLTNMLVSLMPEASGDNVMWKERAVALVASIMPALTWKRDNQEMPMSIGSIRKYLILNQIIALSRDTSLPPKIQEGVKGYLDTLPGYIDEAFDDNGQVKPPGPNQPQVNTETPFQQHGFLSMQLTRALQSLGDEYGYIFDSQAADVDMVDVVLNRRILVVLIPALEKSSDEIANLGKIVAAALKGMMGSSLGTSVEGESATVIENKPTQSATPFITVFDEVGYYTTEGMAVMAAQARSLGFCLIYAAQDLPALEKRVKEEARSITANCNVKLFGKLEDPTQTKEFFENTVGQALVTETGGFEQSKGFGGSYFDTGSSQINTRARASYDGLRAFKEGQAVCTFGEAVVDIRVYYSNPGFAKAMRVTRYLGLPPTDDAFLKHSKQIRMLRDRLVKKGWTALDAEVAADTPVEFEHLKQGLRLAHQEKMQSVEAGIMAVIGVHFDAADKKDNISSGAGEVSATSHQSEKMASPKAPDMAAQPMANNAPELSTTPNAANNTPPAIFGNDGDAASSDGSDPMSFFGAGDDAPAAPVATASASTPPIFAQEAPQAAAASPAPVAPAAPPAQAEGNPMSFFGFGGDEAAAPAAPAVTPAESPMAQAAAPIQPQQDQIVAQPEMVQPPQQIVQDTPQEGPVSYGDLSGATQPMAAQEPPKRILDPATAQTMEQAAQDMKRKLFTNQPNDDLIDAAE